MTMSKPMSNQQHERLDDVRRVADYFGVSIPTVYRLIRSGKLNAHKVGGQWRISSEAVRQFLEDQIHVTR
jgi:excisionase family DNA binding protein